MVDPNRAEHLRVVARSILANLEALQDGGLEGADLERVVALCRPPAASGPTVPVGRDPITELRALLAPVRGLAAAALLGWLLDISPDP